MKVFISHANEDQSSAEKLAKALEKKGFDVIYPSNLVMPGDNWSLKIGQAIEEASAMIVLITPHSGSSKWLQREIEYAVGEARLKDRLIPVMLQKTNNYPWILRKLHFISSLDVNAIIDRLRAKPGKVAAQSAA